MPSFLYRPNHPFADPDGMVTKYDYHMHLAMTSEDKHMMVGNKYVYIGYISDEMPATRHMVNNRKYTSKKKFRDETKARGCVEVGDQTATLLKPRKRIELSKKQRVDDIKKAIYQIQNNMVPK